MLGEVRSVVHLGEVRSPARLGCPNESSEIRMSQWQLLISVSTKISINRKITEGVRVEHTMESEWVSSRFDCDSNSDLMCR
jgi:hypothetical protein